MNTFTHFLWFCRNEWWEMRDYYKDYIKTTAENFLINFIISFIVIIVAIIFMRMVESFLTINWFEVPVKR